MAGRRDRLIHRGISVAWVVLSMFYSYEYMSSSWGKEWRYLMCGGGSLNDLLNVGDTDRGIVRPSTDKQG